MSSSSPQEASAAVTRMEVDEENDSTLDARLIDLRDQLRRASGEPKGGETVPPATTNLLQMATTGAILERLVRLLLYPPPSQQQQQQQKYLMSSDDALMVLGYLCQSVAPDQFLKPAAVAIRTEAERLLLTNHSTSTTSSSSSMQPVVVHVTPALAQVLVQQLSLGTDVQVAQDATRTVVALCRYQWQWAGEIFLPALVEVWRDTRNQANDKNNNISRAQASTTCVRCATAVMEIAVLEDRTMQAAVSSGAMQLWMSTLVEEVEDPLLQMSLLDLLGQLATQHRPCHDHRGQWLLSDAVVEPILRWAGGGDDGAEPDPFLGGPALRVVAALCSVGLQHAQEENNGDNDSNTSGNDNNTTSTTTQSLIPKFHRALHNMMEQQQQSSSTSTSELDRLAMVDALSSLAGSSSDGLTLILEDPVTLRAWLSLAVAQPKLKAAILVSVARVLDPLPERQQQQHQQPSNTLGMKLYASLGQVNANASSLSSEATTTTTTELLLAMAKSPLPETRLAVYTLLQAVAKLPTGGQTLFLHGDFFTFLLDRDRETTKEGREAKWSVVQTLLHHSPVKSLLADDVVRQLETYVQQGPFYVKTLSWEVADQ